MALIDCPGCGNKVSDRAKACPKCGMNLSLKKKQEEQLKEVKHNNLKVDEQPKQLDQPKVQTEELKKSKEEETDKPIFKEEVKEERTSKPNLEEEIKEPEQLISKEISEPKKKKKGNKFWLIIGLIIGFILGVLFWFVLALVIPADKIPSAGNTGTTVVGGTDSQSTENSGSSKKDNVSGATLAFKYVDVSLIPNGLGAGTYKVGKE
jgi:tetrahydromethanopterin S-methyltransferase subunit F